MAAYARPSCSQNTRPQRTPATDVIAVTCSLVQVHTVSTHGESDRRVSKRSSTGAGYAAAESYGSVHLPRDRAQAMIAAYESGFVSPG
ncbi:hypothetical protein GCM10010377_78350 [Streptomyces viridiviolaceus]|nr:hypothetical protein GCM10010377_78350 [Streptomyces viridiviolaceus]